MKEFMPASYDRYDDTDIWPFHIPVINIKVFHQPFVQTIRAEPGGFTPNSHNGSKVSGELSLTTTFLCTSDFVKFSI